METPPGRSQTTRSIGMTYPDDRDDGVNFEAMIWKRSQTTRTIETIENYPRNDHFYSSNRGLIRPGSS